MNLQYADAATSRRSITGKKPAHVMRQRYFQTHLLEMDLAANLERNVNFVHVKDSILQQNTRQNGFGIGIAIIVVLAVIYRVFVAG